MEVFEGHFDAKGMHMAIVASRFNEPIVKRLVEGACDGLKRHGALAPAIYWVPGAFEIPLIAKKLAMSGRYDAIICLGAIIRGETPHFDYVASQTSSGILQAALESQIPIIFSVLTTDTVEQAEARSGIKGGHAGFNGAMTAIEMVSLLQSISQEEPCDLRL
jgi:6,7-dimethyl-8-ribityllumazine synthase